MLTICKITSETAGYEAFNDFCLVRGAKKYLVGSVYVSKVLNRFEDCNGNDHFAVTPITAQPTTTINYDLAVQICKGTHEGIQVLLQNECPEELFEILQNAKDDPHYSISNADEYEQDRYGEAVQSYLSDLVEA